MKRYEINLTAEEESELLAIHRTLKEKRKAYRINVIILLNRGYSKSEVERILLIDRKSILRHVKDYEKGGIEKLLRDDYIPYMGKLTEKEKVKLKKDLREHTFLTAKAVRDHVWKKFDKSYSIDGINKLLHTLGFTYKKAKAVPAKADRFKQEEFISAYGKIRKNIKENEKIFFLDATHPMHNSIPSYGWFEKGSEREIKSNSGRKRVNINGVYSPQDNEIIVREEERVNGEANINLFKEIEERHPYLENIYIIHDNARYNYSKELKEYLKTSKIKMIALPPYSPNLNLIERLWKFMKKKVMYNTYYEQFEDFRKAILKFFEKDIGNYDDVLSTLMRENFHLFEMG